MVSFFIPKRWWLHDRLGKFGYLAFGIGTIYFLVDT